MTTAVATILALISPLADRPADNDYIKASLQSGIINDNMTGPEIMAALEANPHYAGLDKPCRHCGTAPGGYHKCCPRCRVRADGLEEVEALFGFRYRASRTLFTLAPQSQCRDCRSSKTSSSKSMTKKARRAAAPSIPAALAAHTLALVEDEDEVMMLPTASISAGLHRRPHTQTVSCVPYVLNLGPFRAEALTTNTAEGATMIPEVDPDFELATDESVVLANAFLHAENTWVWGPSGTGKTSGVKQLAALLNWPVYRVNMSGDFSSDGFVGHTEVVVDDTTGQAVTRFVDGVLIRAMLNGGILLIDEITAAPPHILLALQAVLEQAPSVEAAWAADKSHCQFVNVANGGEVIHAHRNFRIVVTDNTNGQGDVSGMFAGTNVMNEATRSRFTQWHVKDYPERATWARMLVAKGGVGTKVAAKIVDVAFTVNEGSAALGSVRVTNNLVINPRDTIAVARLAKRFGSQTIAWKVGFLNSLHPTDPDRQFLVDLVKNSVGDE